MRGSHMSQRPPGCAPTCLLNSVRANKNVDLVEVGVVWTGDQVLSNTTEEKKYIEKNFCHI